MSDKTSIIFGNKMTNKVIKKSENKKKKFIKKFGDDSNADYKLSFVPIDTLDFIDTKNIVFSENNMEFPKKSLIVGNIRMGFGHYRISIAMASCAKALGYNPFWMDLASFDSTGSKMIRYQNALYSKASRLSQKFKPFNLYWDWLNCEGFKKISYNAMDQKDSELLIPIFKYIPKDIPFIATHVWPSQGAIHAGLTHVVNAIPDNWPMALHLSEGSMHIVQTEYAYLGYKMLNGFDKKPLEGIPSDSLKKVGCFIDHELLCNLEEDNKLRLDRINNNKPIRIIMTVGGAGAGYKQFKEMIIHLLPYVKEKKLTIFINFGDHDTVYNKLIKDIGNVEITKFFNEYNKFKDFVKKIRNKEIYGIYGICNNNLFEAVYSTNLLMPNSDILITKPGELAYYPIPKLFMKHIGGHEVYGAINSREYGDGTFECPTKKEMNEMLDKLLKDKEILTHMVLRINELKKAGHYDGAYNAVKLAVGDKND